jgi:hypothetical protein
MNCCFKKYFKLVNKMKKCFMVNLTILFLLFVEESAIFTDKGNVTVAK